MLKKISAILLLAVMIFSITACTASDSVIFFTSNEEKTSYETLSHTTFRWGVTRANLFDPLEGATVIGDAILDRYDKMEEEYKLNLIIESFDSKDDVVYTRLATQLDLFDFYWNNMRHTGIPMQKQGVLYALEDIENINPTDNKWGEASYMTIGVIEGKHYGFYPNKWAYNPEIECTLIFNKNVLDDLGIAYPYEYIEAKNWNWNSFRDVLQKVKDGLVSENEIMPWCSAVYNEDVVGMMLANGLDPLVRSGESGLWSYGFDCSEGIDVLNYMSDLRARGLLYNKNMDAMKNGYGAFYSADTSTATTIGGDGRGGDQVVSSVQRYGIAPFPQGPNAKENSSSGCFFNTTDINFIFNVTENSPAQLGLFMEAMWAELDGVPDWKGYCQEHVFEEGSKDYEFFIRLIENARYDLSGFYTESSSDLDTYYKQVVKGELSAAECFEMVRPMFTNDLSTYKG